MKLIDITCEQLLNSSPVNMLSAREDDEITIYRSSVAGEDFDLINVFSPKGKIFWSFGLFLAAANRAYEYGLEVENIGERFALRLAKKSGVSFKTASLYEFFAQFTSGKGLEYFPYNEGDQFHEARFLAQRHISIAIPKQSFSALVNYFSAQINEIGDGCFKDMAENKVMIIGDEYPTYNGFNALCNHHSKINVAQLNEVDQLLKHQCVRDYAEEELLNLIGCRGGINCHLLPNSNAVAESITVSRLKIAEKIICLPRLERMVADFDRGGLGAIGARREFLESMRRKLSQYPVIKEEVID